MGDDTRARHREIARRKLVRHAEPLTGEREAEALADAVEALPGAGPDAVASLSAALGALLGR